MGHYLVVGANRGIGLSLTQQLVKRGDKVTAACRSSSKELAALGPAVEVVEGMDVTAGDSAAKLAQRLEGRKIDALVVVAGILQRVDLEQMDFAKVEGQFQANALGPLRLAAGLHKSIANGGKMMFVTSRMGSIADNTSGGHYGYRMSKAALNMAAKSLAHDLRGEGIAVAVVHPGFVKTDMTGGRGDVTPDQSAANILQRIDQLSLSNTGTFWHANGETLPW